jgi:predicted glutamine amidotransferase
MCRLLGIYRPEDGWREIVSAFSRQADTGNIAPVENIKPGHKDGWGMTVSNSQQSAMVPYVRQLGSACQSPGFRQALELLPDKPGILLCHLRKASPTIPITLSNTHPFVHKGRTCRKSSSNS